MSFRRLQQTKPPVTPLAVPGARQSTLQLSPTLGAQETREMNASLQSSGLLLWLVLPLMAATVTADAPAPRLPSGSDSEAVHIPELIRARAHDYLCGRLGDSFVQQHVVLDTLTSYMPVRQICLSDPDQCAEYLLSPYYRMIYRLEAPHVGSRPTYIDFALDPEGNLVEGYHHSGLPDCVSTPEECAFSIDREAAQQIAANAGLAEGVRPWETRFRWSSEFETFVWFVSNTVFRDGSRASGRIVLIDANSGDVLPTNQMWLETH